jgi:hypothetical protein
MNSFNIKIGKGSGDRYMHHSTQYGNGYIASVVMMDEPLIVEKEILRYSREKGYTYKRRETIVIPVDITDTIEQCITRYDSIVAEILQLMMEYGTIMQYTIGGVLLRSLTNEQLPLVDAVLPSPIVEPSFESYIDMEWKGADHLYKRVWCTDRKSFIIKTVQLFRDRASSIQSKCLEDIAALMKLGGQDLYALVNTTDRTTLKYRNKDRIEPLYNSIMAEYHIKLGFQIWIVITRMFSNVLLIPTTMKQLGSGGSSKFEYTLDMSDWFLFHAIIDQPVNIPISELQITEKC